MKKIDFNYLDKIPELSDKIDVWANSYTDEIRSGHSKKKFAAIQKQFHKKLREIMSEDNSFPESCNFNEVK